MSCGSVVAAHACLAAIFLQACTPAGRTGDRPSSADSSATPAAQAPPAELRRTSDQDGGAGVEGVVGTIGVEPMVTVVIRRVGDAPTQVTGALAVELARLTGATVYLLGDVRPQTPWPVIEPTGYEVITVDGQKPYVGTLRVEGTEVRLESDSTLRLLEVPELLRQQNGAKIYVLGRLQERGLAVSSFGVIRPPSR